MIEYPDATVGYVKTGRLAQGFRVDPAQVVGLVISKTRRPGRCLLVAGRSSVLAEIDVPIGTGERIDQYLRAHPRFAGTCAAATLKPPPPISSRGRLAALLGRCLAETVEAGASAAAHARFLGL